MAVGDIAYYKFLKICIIVILSQRIWGTCMSRIKFEQAYSGKNNLEGIKPRMSVNHGRWRRWHEKWKSTGHFDLSVLEDNKYL